MEKIESLDELILKAKQLFESEYGSSAEIINNLIIVCAPGRVNLIGEHTDYNFGYVFPMAIPLYTVIAGKSNDSNKIKLITDAQVDSPRKVEFDSPSETSRLTPSDLPPKWVNYVKGVIEHFPNKNIPGFSAAIISSVPIGGGLSSSASIEVATCTFLEALTGLSLELKEKALLCQKAEHTHCSMPCGVMDQFISCMGKENYALLIDCLTLEAKLVPLSSNDSDSEEISFLVLNSNVKHELTGSEYPERRNDCFEAAKILGVESLREATMSGLREKRDKLGDRVYQRALHVVTEIERCTKASSAFNDKTPDYSVFGNLMYQSHVSLRDLYEVSCKEIDQLVDITMKCPGVYGSRITGGGFGGCVIALVKSSEVQNVIEEVHKKYTKKATCYVFKAVDGASRIQ